MAAQGAVPRGLRIDPAEANVWTGLVLGALVGSAAVGAAFDLWLKRRRRRCSQETCNEPTSSCWAVCLMTASYVVLIPGYVAPLFDTEVSLVIFGHEQQLNSKVETSVGLIQQLIQKEVYLAAIFVTLYAMVVPAIKAVLLIACWYLQRGGPGNPRIQWARGCILSVQAISKWASPDMFAYLLMTCLFRGFSHPPLLVSDMKLGVGFSCFSLFCIGSTISCLGLQAPALPAKEVEQERRSGLLHGCDSRLLAMAVTVCFVAFAALFGIGIQQRAMDLHFDLQLLYKYHPRLEKMSALFNSMGLADLLHTEVSILSAIESLARWAWRGDLACAIGAIMYGLFVIILPVLDMLLLLTASILLSGGLIPFGLRSHRTILAVARVTRKLAMLDVALMGTFVVVVALKPWRSHGVVLSSRCGAYALLCAEAFHYLTAYLVESMLKDNATVEPASPGSTEAPSDDGDISHDTCSDQDSNDVVIVLP